MRYPEAVSKRVLEAILPSVTLKYRESQSNAEYDFDLQYPDGTSAAVEVTASVDQTLAQTRAAIRNKRKGGAAFKAPTCKSSWLIFPTKDTSIDTLRKDADSQLAKLEQAGIQQFDCVSNSELIQDVCCRLNIRGGAAILTDREPTIRIRFPLGGGAVGASDATKAGEREAWKEDNRKKLGAARSVERHLVVYMDAANGLPSIALTTFPPPPDLPNLPVEVTVLWLIGHTDNADEFVAWRGYTSEPWQRVRVVSPAEALRS